jgi:hypothetical protein
MVGRPSVKHAGPMVLDVVNNGIGKRHALIANNIVHGTRAGNVLCYSKIYCKGSRDDQEDGLSYFVDPHGHHLSASAQSIEKALLLLKPDLDKPADRFGAAGLGGLA